MSDKAPDKKPPGGWVWNDDRDDKRERRMRYRVKTHDRRHGRRRRI